MSREFRIPSGCSTESHCRAEPAALGESVLQTYIVSTELSATDKDKAGIEKVLVGKQEEEVKSMKTIILSVT